MERVFSVKEKKVITYIIIFVFVTLIAVSVIVLGNRYSNNNFSTDNYYKASYCVKKGDTLWELGESYKRENDDVREWIKAVKEINGISSAIQTNDYITILIAKNSEREVK